jgi:hypothetical protein
MMSDTYDAGYLPDDADCDQDSIRCELAYSHEFYSSIIQQNEGRIAELEKALKNLLAATDGVYSNSCDLAQAEGAAQEALKEQG